MADLPALRQRSSRLFSTLMQPAAAAPAAGLGAAPGVAAAPRPFSVFDPEDATRAAAMALGFSVLAAKGPPEEGAEAALAKAEALVERVDPELLAHSMALFVTHDPRGRRLFKPRSTLAAPQAFAPSAFAAAPAVAAAAVVPGGSTGIEPPIDFWREDPLANEHHQHWHEVYPSFGLPPLDWLAWASSVDRAALPELLTGLGSQQDVEAFAATATPEEIRDEFLVLAAPLVENDLGAWIGFVFGLSVGAFRALQALNQRHGELFFYMHQQMLARYDAERLSFGLPTVEAWDAPDAAILEGYDPGPLLREIFNPRAANRTLSPGTAAQLGGWRQELEHAIADQNLIADGTPRPIDRVNLGEEAEAVNERFRAPAAVELYGSYHNTGHGRIAALSRPNLGGRAGGVMRSTATAIRDPVFWRWHKAIDDLGFTWQETQPAYDFTQEPLPVRLRRVLPEAPDASWSSPDLILCRTADLPGSSEPGFLETGGPTLGEQAFGGAAWDQDFAAAEVTVGGASFTTVSELKTEVRQGSIPLPDDEALPVRYLAHEPFCYFLRLENPGAEDASVTARIFLVPEPALEDSPEDRRSWIEMDKFVVTVPAGTRRVAFRADEQSSVIKRPADRDLLPQPQDPGQANGSGSYCECGWPYRLLLPSGTEAGLPCRLLVFLSDAAKDKMVQPGRCGSLSYCGARDRYYPDEKDMGYPFSRPFAGPLDEVLAPLTNAAGRTLTIKRSTAP